MPLLRRKIIPQDAKDTLMIGAKKKEKEKKKKIIEKSLKISPSEA